MYAVYQYKAFRWMRQSFPNSKMYIYCCYGIPRTASRLVFTFTNRKHRFSDWLLISFLNYFLMHSVAKTSIGNSCCPSLLCSQIPTDRPTEQAETDTRRYRYRLAVSPPNWWAFSTAEHTACPNWSVESHNRAHAPENALCNSKMSIYCCYGIPRTASRLVFTFTNRKHRFLTGSSLVS